MIRVMFIAAAVLLAGPAYAQTDVLGAWASCQAHRVVSAGASKGNPARVRYDSKKAEQACEAVKKQIDDRDDARRRAAYRQTHP